MDSSYHRTLIDKNLKRIIANINNNISKGFEENSDTAYLIASKKFITRQMIDQLINPFKGTITYNACGNYSEFIIHNIPALTVDDLNIIIDGVYNKNNITDMFNLSRALVENYPQYMEFIDVNKLIYFNVRAVEIGNFIGTDLYAWIILNDAIGKQLVKAMILNGRFIDYVNNLSQADNDDNSYSVFSYSCSMLKEYYGADKLTIGTFMNYYGLNEDMLLGVDL